MLSEKMRLSELVSSAFFHLYLAISLLCYLELFPVTGAGINLFVLIFFSVCGYVSQTAVGDCVQTLYIISADTRNRNFSHICCFFLFYMLSSLY